MAKTYDDRWEIVKPLGEGGQAQTFLVKDTRGSGTDLYALKRLRDVNRLDRFKREIETIRNLTHENVLRLVDFNLDGPKPYLVSEYCAGGSLPNAQPFWQDSAISALKLFQQICQGVSYAHSHGVIHRDLNLTTYSCDHQMGLPWSVTSESVTWKIRRGSHPRIEL